MEVLQLAMDFARFRDIYRISIDDDTSTVACNCLKIYYVAVFLGALYATV